MTSPLTEHRQQIAARQAAARTAWRYLAINHGNDGANAMLIAALIDAVPEAVVAACDRLQPKETPK
jgi:hypothetical protein